MKLSEKVTELRKANGITQEELAERAELTCQTISTAETGKKALRPENIIRLCAALDISTEYLLRGKISTEDTDLLSRKVSKLSPVQYRHLEDIINSYIAAVSDPASKNIV